MRFRLLPLGLLIATCAWAAKNPSTAPMAPVSRTGTKANAPARRGLEYIDGIPDTGQFLPDTTWLARVNDRVTRISDFVADYFSGNPEFRPGPDSLGRVEFLNNLIDHDVMGLVALSAGRPFDFEDRAQLREDEATILSNAVFERYVSDSVKVTEADVDEVGRQLGFRARFRHILFADPVLAEQVRREIVGGRIDWNTAVKRYTIAKDDVGSDGDLGWLDRSKLSNDLAFTLYSLHPGQTSQVIEDLRGFHLVQMTDRKDVEAPDIRPMRNIIRKQLIAARSGARAEVIQKMLRERVGLAYDTTNVKYVSSKFGDAVAFKQDAFGPILDISGTVPEFSPEDTAKTLATWKGGRLSIGQFLHAYSDITPVARPNLNFPAAVMSQIDATALLPYQVDLARERGLDKDPRTIAQIAGKREELLVNHMYQDSVESHVYVTAQQRRDYYEQNKRQFFTYQAVDFAAIVRHNQKGADSVMAALKSGARAPDILAADSLKGEVTGSIKHMREDEHGPYAKILFEELRPGEATVTGPDRVGDYLCLQLLKYDPGHQLTFEESQNMIDESLQNIQADARLKALLVGWRKRFAIASRPELVMRIKLLQPH
ncbi:MAG TPA: peptidyl-prolyl cis-trans isomerase [Candidatus Acidoferrales bacterium]|nr:peptidyl-prolyl cis-trans isomerase [Candidatus Acidoferrales bacterium]